MKQLQIIYIMLVTAVLCGVSAQAETVESISYNPSRLGVFSYLKVQDNAILRGGVTTPYLNINTRNASLEGANKIQTGAVTISNTAELTNAELSDSVTHDNYAYTQTPTNVAGTVTMNGGKAEVSEDSFINNLNNVGKVKLKAHNTIYAPGVKIQGNSASVGFVDGSSKGWQLGKYEIPLPTQVADGADYEYIWQEMQFKNKKATVLTLQKENPIYKWQRLGDSDCFWNKFYTGWYGCSNGALSMYFHCPLVRNAYGLEAGERWGPNSYTKTAWNSTTNCTSGYWEPQEHKTQWCQWYVDWLKDRGRNAVLLEGAFKDTLHKYTGELCDQENIIGVQTIGDGGGMDGSAAFGYDQFDAFGCAAYLCTRQ